MAGVERPLELLQLPLGEVGPGAAPVAAAAAAAAVAAAAAGGRGVVGIWKDDENVCLGSEKGRTRLMAQSRTKRTV